MQSENLIKKELRPIGIKWDLETKKEVAKIGMTASLGIVVGTSFAMKSKVMTNLHIGAGVALVGFSLWHHLLYQSPKNKSNAKSTKPLTETENSTTTESHALVLKEVFASIALEGSLTHEELHCFEDQLDALLAAYSKPATLLLVDVTRLHSIEAGAVWHNLMAGLTKKHSEIKSIAIIGQSKLKKFSISFTNAIMSTNIRYFESEESAKEWLIAQF